MEVYIDIEFPLSVGRYSEKGGTLSSEQYLPYILSIGNLSLNIGDDHSFEVSNVPIVFDDIDNHFRNKFADDIDKNIQGSLVKFYQLNGTKITTLKIWDYQFLDRKFQINCTNKIGELWNDFTEKITFEEFPNTSSVDSVGQVIPDVYGEMATTAGGMIKGWQVEANKYLVNATVIGGSTLDAAYLEDGTDITGDCVLSATADGLRTTVTYNLTNPDSIICDITIGAFRANNVQDVLEANLNKWVGFNSGNYTANAALDTLLDGASYNNQFRGFANYVSKTGNELLKEFCDSYNVDWITNSDNEVEIKFIDINNLTANYTIQDNKAKEFSYTSNTDPEDYANKILSQGNYYYSTGVFNKQFEFDEFESQSVNGIRPVNLDAKFLKTDENIVWTAKYYAMFNKNPRQRAYTQMNTDDWFVEALEVGDLIEFKHPNDRLKGLTNILYQIKKVNINFQGSIVDLELWDIDYLKDIDTDVNLLIQPNINDGYLDYFDMSMTMDGTGNHVLNPALSIENSSTQVVFGDSSAHAWGSRRITSPDSVSWDIFGGTTNSTLSAYIFPIDWSNTFSDFQPIFHHWFDVNNSWRFGFESAGGGAGSTGKIQYLVRSGGADIDVATGATINPINNWIHVALCRVGLPVDRVGLYVNGVQDAYDLLSGAFATDGKLYIFGNNQNSTYLQGYVAEAFLTNNNFYGANPDAGLTDTITPHWSPLTQSADLKTMQVYNPRLGDELKRGRTYRIKWNIPGMVVNVTLVTTAGAFVKNLALGLSNQSYYDWTVDPAETIIDRKILVTLSGIAGTKFDHSDIFSVIA